MKEIRFRFWHKEYKKFISPYGLGYQFQPENGQIYADGMNITDRFIRSQYTGLKDKNGKDIYEGDIDGSDEPMYVTYEDGSYGLKFKNNQYFDNCIDWKFTEIIGNIFENDELLKF